MTYTLFIVQIVLAVLITIAVLLQKSSSMGLGAYSGSNESVFGAKGPAGFLVKITFLLGFLFIVNTLALGYMYSKDSKSSVVDEIKTTKKVDSNKTTVPAVPSVPATPAKTEAPSAPKVENNTTK